MPASADPPAKIGGHPIIIPTAAVRRRGKVTPISIRPIPQDSETRPANDNLRGERAGFSILDLLPQDSDAAGVAQRAERLGNAVVIAMAFCLVVAPALYIALIYAR